MAPGLELLDVDRLGPLVSLLLLVGDAQSLGQRAIAVHHDSRVVDEEVAIALIGRDEPEPLVVAEPLDGTGGHLASSSQMNRRAGSSPGSIRRERTNVARQRAGAGTSISRLRILPVGPLGSSSTNQMRRGYLYAATWSLTKSRSSSGSTLSPSLSATAAPTSSPRSSCGTPTTATSRTAGCS